MILSNSLVDTNIQSCLNSLLVLCFSVPTFKDLPEETLSKIADVLEEVRIQFTDIIT